MFQEEVGESGTPTFKEQSTSNMREPKDKCVNFTNVATGNLHDASKTVYYTAVMKINGYLTVAFFIKAGTLPKNLISSQESNFTSGNSASLNY